MRPEGPYAEPDWATDYEGRPLIIVGCAPNVQSDLGYARERYCDYHIMALKEAIVVTDDITHEFTAHSDRCAALIEYRKSRYPDQPVPFVHTMRTPGFQLAAGFTHVWSNISARGSSVQAAIQIARAMKYGDIVLAGCPMNQPGYFNEGVKLEGFRYDRERIGNDPKSPHAVKMRQILEAYLSGIRGVYSMSGWTRELLGLPPAK